IAGVGAYTTAILSVKFGVPVVLSVPLAAMTGILAGLLIAYGMALRLKRLYLGIGTFALGEAMVVAWLNWGYVGGAFGFLRIPVLTDVGVGYGIVAGLTFLVWGFEKSHQGLAFRAVFDDELPAAAMGVNVTRVKMLAWTMGAGITAVGGALYAHSLS